LTIASFPPAAGVSSGNFATGCTSRDEPTTSSSPASRDSGATQHHARLGVASDLRQLLNLRSHGRRVPAVDGFRFHTDLTVRFAETDAQGVAHNSNYLVWFEVARIAYLAEYAGGYSALRAQGMESFVLEAHTRYLRPAHFDDLLRIHARIADLRGARFRFEYAVARGADVIADGWTSHACVDARTRRPTRIPGWLFEAIRGAETL
jgi:acyl-CoA thioester hydrolase